MKRSSIFLFIFFIIGLHQASAAVVINEIAWMGTTVSANAEWIELFNNGSDPITLDGWSLKAADGSPNINLAGTISSNSYFLLERTSDESVSNITANQIYSGSMSNTGEDFVLRNNLNEIVDEVNALSGWQAGDNTTKQTMQLNNGVWITAVGTPGLINYVPEVTQSSTSSTTTATSSTTTQTITTINQVKDEDRTEIISVKPDTKYTAKMKLIDFATAGTPIMLSADIKQDAKIDKVTGRFEWYLGDGSAYRYLKNTSFEHVFYYPGDYVVVMEYYSNYFKEEPDSIHKKVITIIPANITITEISDDGGIIFSNDSTKEINLDQWKIYQGNMQYTFPKWTIVSKNKTLTISSKILGFELKHELPIRLYNSNNTLVSTYEVQKNE